jgi:hypothetical protein
VLDFRCLNEYVVPHYAVVHTGEFE